MKNVLLVTDGACINNPGPGGWACVLRFNESVAEMFGSEPNSTNNRMELRAVIEGLKIIKEPCAVTIFTDSQYVKNGITEWIHKWKANSWLHKVKGQSGPQPIKNRDLWMELEKQVLAHRVKWEWVKGHANHADNNRCDYLATKAAREQISSNGLLKRPAPV